MRGDRQPGFCGRVNRRLPVKPHDMPVRGFDLQALLKTPHWSAEVRFLGKFVNTNRGFLARFAGGKNSACLPAPENSTVYGRAASSPNMRLGVSLGTRRCGHHAR